jgi:hypothetical protein
MPHQEVDSYQVYTGVWTRAEGTGKDPEDASEAQRPVKVLSQDLRVRKQQVKAQSMVRYY